MLIEFTACLLAAAAWAVGVVVTWRRGPEMVTVLLALGAAVAYGLSDFLGGVVSRRTSVWPVALTACLGAAIGTVVPGPGPARRPDRRPTSPGGCWPASAAAPAPAFLYRGFATGRMGVVAPVSAVGAALLPAALGVVTGERPTAPRLDRASSSRCRASGWSLASRPTGEHGTPSSPPGWSTACWPDWASGSSSPRWARCRTGPATGRWSAPRWSRWSPSSSPPCCWRATRSPAGPSSGGGWRRACWPPRPWSRSCSPASRACSASRRC